MLDFNKRDSKYLLPSSIGNELLHKGELLYEHSNSSGLRGGERGSGGLLQPLIAWLDGREPEKPLDPCLNKAFLAMEGIGRNKVVGEPELVVSPMSFWEEVIN